MSLGTTLLVIQQHSFTKDFLAEGGFELGLAERGKFGGLSGVGFLGGY